MQETGFLQFFYSIKGKLISGFSLLIILLAILAYMGINSLSVMNDRLNSIVDISAEKVKLAARINQGALAISRAEKNVILAKTQQEMDEFAAFTNETRDEMKQRRAHLRELVNDEDKKIVDKFANYWDQYIEINKEVRTLARLNSNVRADILSKGDARDAYEAASIAIASVVTRNDRSLAETNTINDVRTVGERIKLAARINRNLVEIQRGEKNMILSSTQQEMDGFANAIKQISIELDDRLDILKEIVSDEGRNEVNVFEQAYTKYFVLHEEVREITRENGNKRAFDLSNGKARELNDKSIELMARLVTKSEDDMANDSNASDKNYSIARNLMLTIAGIGLLAGIIIALYIANNVSGALQRLLKSLQEIAQGDGDLTVTIDDSSKDETGDVARAFNMFVAKLRAVIMTIASSTSQVAATAEELSVTSKQTGTGMQELSAQTQMVAAAMTEMSASVQEVAKNAENAALSAGEANTSAESGDRVVKETIGAVNTLSNEIETSAEAIEKLKDDSDKIGKVLDVIKGIAEQTNLLALNAAIEAARAGEQGRGFAVVADEVRTLAQRTQESTSEIEEMINNLQSGTSRAVTVMINSSEQSRHVVEKAREAGEMLTAIISSVTAISDMNNQIATAAEEQTVVAEEINRNVVNVQMATVQSAAATEQTSSSSLELAKLGEDLQIQVRQFKI
jgi:methyl-accepting chemotaxis protein